MTQGYQKVTNWTSYYHSDSDQKCSIDAIVKCQLVRFHDRIIIGFMTVFMTVFMTEIMTVFMTKIMTIFMTIFMTVFMTVFMIVFMMTESS